MTMHIYPLFHLTVRKAHLFHPPPGCAYVREFDLSNPKYSTKACSARLEFRYFPTALASPYIVSSPTIARKTAQAAHLPLACQHPRPPTTHHDHFQPSINASPARPPCPTCDNGKLKNLRTSSPGRRKTTAVCAASQQIGSDRKSVV